MVSERVFFSPSLLSLPPAYILVLCSFVVATKNQILLFHRPPPPPSQKQNVKTTCTSASIHLHTFQQYDLGTSEKTTISTSPAMFPVLREERQEQHEQGREEEEEYGFPALVQHFTGGTRCPSPAAAKEPATAAGAGAKDGSGGPGVGRVLAAGQDAGSGRRGAGARREYQVVSRE